MLAGLQKNLWRVQCGACSFIIEDAVSRVEMFTGKTFDDFLLKPQLSIVARRKSVDVSMPLVKGINLQMPLVGANMDTVTGPEMARALALEGGIGFLHRNCTITQQVEWVRYVKTRHAYKIEKPVVLPLTASLGTAKQIINQHRASGILIETFSGSGILAGILSHRDIPWDDDTDLKQPVEQLMTPLKQLTIGREDTSQEDAKKILFRIKKEKLPLVDADNRICGLITMRDLKLHKQKPYSSKDDRGRLRVGAAIGATGDFVERTEALVEAEADCVLMDVAHAHSASVIKPAMQKFRKNFPDIPLIVGNVGTGSGAEFLRDLGADAIKVGIGPGRGCRTRLETSAGVPQLQAIYEAFLFTEGKVPIIADGGIRENKDIFLAIACGASTVMLGSKFAGTDESLGDTIRDPVTHQKKKVYRGMTSPQAVLNNSNESDVSEALETPAEGQSLEVPHQGSVSDVIKSIRGHLQSAVSYAGGETLREVQGFITAHPERYLIPLSGASRRESFER